MIQNPAPRNAGCSDDADDDETRHEIAELLFLRHEVARRGSEGKREEKGQPMRAQQVSGEAAHEQGRGRSAS